MSNVLCSLVPGDVLSECLKSLIRSLNCMKKTSPVPLRKNSSPFLRCVTFAQYIGYYTSLPLLQYYLVCVMQKSTMTWRLFLLDNQDRIFSTWQTPKIPCAPRQQNFPNAFIHFSIWSGNARSLSTLRTFL